MNEDNRPEKQSGELLDEVAQFFQQRDESLGGFAAVQHQWQSSIYAKVIPGEIEAAQEREKELREASRRAANRTLADAQTKERAWHQHRLRLKQAHGRLDTNVQLQSNGSTIREISGRIISLPDSVSGTLQLHAASPPDDEDAGYLGAIRVAFELEVPGDGRFTSESYVSLHQLMGLELLGNRSSITPALRDWTEAGDAERAALADRCLLPPVQLISGDGMYYEICISGRKITVGGSSPDWWITLALLPAGTGVLCRVDQLTETRFEQPGHSNDAEFEEVPPFWFVLPPSSFAPLGQQRSHFSTLQLLDDVMSEETEITDAEVAEYLIRWTGVVE